MKKIIIPLAVVSALIVSMPSLAITDTVDSTTTSAYEQKLLKQQQKYELKAEKIRQKEELKRLKKNGGVISPIKEATMTLGTAQKTIKIGTSQDEVAMALGAPNIVTVDSEGYDTWIYDKVSSVTTYNNDGFEIGAKLLGGGYGSNGAGGGLIGTSYGKSKGGVQTNQKTLTIVIKFKNNKVSSFKYHMSSF
jgi:outer membrane protein assembly factor BamE (lipoprotein component of BamABCDE complex)